MDRKIYLLTSGSYSDYRVEAAFANEEDAKAVAKSQDTYHRDAGFDVEEYVIYESIPERRVKYEVSADHRAANVIRAHHGGPATSEVEGGWSLWESSRPLWPWEWDIPANCRAKSHTGNLDLTPAPNGRIRDERWWFRVDGWDEEAVRKVVYDTITRCKAVLADQALP